MDAKFLLKQCKVAEDAFFRGGRDVELRDFVQHLIRTNSLVGGDTASGSLDSSEESVDIDSDESSDLELMQDAELADDAPTVDLDEFMATGLKGGAVGVANTAASAWTGAPMLDNLALRDNKKLTSDYQIEDTGKLESMLDGLHDAVGELETQQLDEQLDQVQSRQIQAAQDRQHEALSEQLDLMSDPMWVQSGAEYLDYCKHTANKFHKDVAIAVRNGDVLTKDGYLSRPESSYAAAIAWMDRLRVYLGTDPYKTMPMTQAKRLYVECVAIIQTNGILAGLPVCPAWLRFQQYVLDHSTVTPMRY